MQSGPPAGPAEAADRHRQRRLPGDADLEIPGAKAAVHGAKPPQQVIPQALCHALPAHQRTELEISEVKALRLGLIDEVLQEGPLAGD